MNIKEFDNTYIANTYARFPVELVSGKGSLVYDKNGKEYIDFGSGIAVNVFGVCDDEWTKAVTDQLGKIQHSSNLYYTAPDAILAKMLCEKTGMKKVFFSNSGAEANECAIKAARRHAFNKYCNESHSTIITLKQSFHGRTLATLTATGQDSFHKEFGPFLPGFVYAEPNNLDSVEDLLKSNGCAAVMMECIQGEGGVIALDKEFVQGVEKLCRKYDVLLIIDEVQTGNGRSGKLYSYMNFDIHPDIVTTAKGLGGGLPIGATMLGERAVDCFVPGTHGSTFGGNPVSCAGACNILSRIDEDLLSEVEKKSQYIFDTMSKVKGVVSVTGMGLMIGIETEKPCKEIIADCRENGLLVLSAKTKLRLLPALNIPFDILKKGIEILTDAIAK